MAGSRKTPPPFRRELPTLIPDFDPAELAEESEVRLRNAEATSPEAPPLDERQCLASLGGANTVFIVAVDEALLKHLPLDHVSGFILSLMDGMTTVGNVLDLVSLPPVVVLGHIRDLVEREILVAANVRARP